jgi:MFS family permease
LTIGTFILIAGRLGDVFGYKRIFLSGFVWSALWAAFAGVTVFRTYSPFAVCRVLQGIGAALCLPNAIALLETTYAPRRKNSMIFALIVATAPTGSLLGAMGSSLLALTWWSIAYWVFAAVLAAIDVIGYFAVPSADNECITPENFEAAVKDLDIPGAIAGVSALVLISFAFLQGPIRMVRSVCLAHTFVGVLLAFIFIAIECFYAPNPIIPLSALNTTVSFALVAIACGWACFGIWPFYSWQLLQVIRGLPP